MTLEAALHRADHTIERIGGLIEGLTAEVVPDARIRNELVDTLHGLASQITLASASVLAGIEALDGERVDRAHQLLCRHIQTASKALPVVESVIAEV